ncbi:MAG: WG repeat-containing protein [Cruoricaptor ignavus]|nr:WG repeat-containing protein [Cruoricaptor ignavus]
MKYLLIFLIICSCGSAKKFKIINQNDDYNTYYIADKKGKIIKKLDSSYQVNFNEDSLGYFTVFYIKGEKGWMAINIDENRLFEVYNTEIGTPSPDVLIENKIRIIDANNRIGFANKKGKIVIKPQFEMVSSFHKNKAIIGEECEKIPWAEHPEEADCQHYSIQCKKHGFINKKGKIIKFGNYTFEEIQKEIDWKYK